MANKPDPTLLATLQTQVAALAKNPSDTALRTTIIRGQVALTAKQLNVSPQRAGDVVRSFTAAYATSKSVDAQATIDALNAEEQQVLNYSKDQPKLYGLDLITANQLAGYIGIGSGLVLTASIVLFVAAIFVVGPEVALAVAGAEGVLATIAAAVGAAGSGSGAALIGGGSALFLLSQMLGHFATNIPMMTKQMIDNGSIGPGLRISAIKQAEEEKAKLQGTVSPGPFSGTQFASYAGGLEAAGIIAINNPCQFATVQYSRKALADLVTCVYGKATSSGAPTTVTKFIPQLRPYLVMPGGGTSFETIEARAAAEPSSSGSIAPVQTVRVFTGLISQGTLGDGTAFTPRPDDLISSTDELQVAAANNLAATLAALPSALVYEIKIVSSVTSKDGFTQHGGSQQIISGYTTSGTPKYKTVVNKFAVLSVYLVNEKNTRTKIRQITLGPVDVVRFNPSQVQISGVETSIQGSIATSDTSQIRNITAPAVPTYTPVATPPPPPPPTPVAPKTASSAYGLGTQVGSINGQPVYSAGGVYFLEGKSGGSDLNSMLNFYFPGHAGDFVPLNAPVAAAPAKAAPAAAVCRATTLYELSVAQAVPLPKVAQRAPDYERLGLGKASMYTGTAEQNTKLLAALQRELGC